MATDRSVEQWSELFPMYRSASGWAGATQLQTMDREIVGVASRAFNRP